MQASLSKTESITGVANGDPAVHLARGVSFGSPPRYRRAENQLLWGRALDHGSGSIDQLRDARAAEAGIADVDSLDATLFAKTPPAIELLTRYAQSLAIGIADLQTLMMPEIS